MNTVDWLLKEFEFWFWWAVDRWIYLAAGVGLVVIFLIFKWIRGA